MEGKLFSLQEGEDFLIMLSPVSCQHQATILLISNDDRSMLLSIGLLTESNEDLCFSHSVDLLTLMRTYAFFHPADHDLLNQMRTFASLIQLTY